MEAFVELNHGRWIVNCPACPNAFLESQVPDMCPNCQTVITKVTGPAEKERFEIYQVTSIRPEENRNWVPGESISDLVAENIAYGVDNP
jgi:uncharacterized Zn finger protein (UPF0148 family)